MSKDKARILDAGCGNRTMYRPEGKDRADVLYVDIEKDLSFPPDMIVDITNMPFEDKRFHLERFDPPHEYGRTKNTSMYTTPNREACNEKWPEWARKGHPRYYGTDKFKTKKELKEYIYYAQKELHRVGSDDCTLMFKWSENKFDLDEAVNLFTGWIEIMRIPIKTISENATPSYWVMFMKRDGPRQGSL